MKHQPIFEARNPSAQAQIAKSPEAPLPELLRTDAIPNHGGDHSYRMKELLARVPESQVEKVFKIMEDVVDLL